MGLSLRLSALRSVHWGRVIVGTLLITGIVFAYIEFDAAKLQQGLVWMQAHPVKGGALFLLVYTCGVVFMLPAMVMGMLAGAVFGAVAGGLLAWVGTSVGQVLAFVAGRYLLRDAVAAYLTRQFPQWTAIDAAIGSEALKLVTLLRLSPVAPWNVLNYALAVTAVPLGAYAGASALAVIPYLVLFVYAGSLARSLADIFSGDAGLESGPLTLALAIGSGALMVGAVAYTTHVSRRAIAAALRHHADALPPELTTDADVIALLQVADEFGPGVHEGPATTLSPRWAGRPGDGGWGTQGPGGSETSAIQLSPHRRWRGGDAGSGVHPDDEQRVVLKIAMDGGDAGDSSPSTAGTVPGRGPHVVQQQRSRSASSPRGGGSRAASPAPPQDASVREWNEVEGFGRQDRGTGDVVLAWKQDGGERTGRGPSPGPVHVQSSAAGARGSGTTSPMFGAPRPFARQRSGVDSSALPGA